jgi:hypothetical protein
MALILMECSATGRKVSTGMRIKGSTWNRDAEFYAYSRCPACNGYHAWSAKDATLVDDEIEVPEIAA